MNLLKSTNPAVIEEYANLLEEELRNFTIPENMGNENSETVYELEESGATITVVTETSPSSEIPLLKEELKPKYLTSEVTAASTSSTNYYSRSYGTYSYSIKYYIRAIGWPDAVAGLLTNYSVRSDGLRVNWASTAGTSGYIPTTIVGSSKVTDARAEKRGYDINAMGNYTVTIGGYNGIGLIFFDMTLVSRVLWHSTYSGGLNVGQSYSEYGDKSQ